MSLPDKHAEHGGAFFDAIGVDFDHLENREQVINADVLDAWYDPSPKVIDAMRKHLTWLIRTSPPTHGEGLVHAIQRVRGLPEECILIGSGTSSLIYQALPHLVRPSAKVLVLDPSYGEYQHLFDNVLQAQMSRHELSRENEFVPDLDRLCREAAGMDLVVLVNPNSPTGVAADAAFVQVLLDSLSTNTLLWVDETYVDFVPGLYSVEPLVGKDPRLIVCKSMSKFFALSGLRVGYLAAHPDVVERLEPLSPPWPVGLVSQVAAVEALHDMPYYQAKAVETAKLREAFATSLAGGNGITVFPSVTNFLLVELPKPCAAELVAAARQERIFLRNCDSMSTRFAGRYIRTAVKTAGQNARIAEFLKSFLS